MILGFASSLLAIAQQDSQLDQLIKSIAAAHHGHVALYAHNLRTGQTASLLPDEPVQTASVIKMGVLLDAALPAVRFCRGCRGQGKENRREQAPGKADRAGDAETAERRIIREA